tara:strand:- start:161 stop:736 length:576 start_codon:yes stop_codon:yes gene_type:complete
MNNGAIFLDRDGIINYDYGYVHKICDFKFIPNVLSTLRLLNELKMPIFIITNQAGIARGFYTKEDLFTLHNYLLSILKENKINIKEIFFCPHHSEGKVPEYSFDCNCRKPKPGMILEAKKKYNLNLSDSFLIGDKYSDVQAGINAGIKTNIITNLKNEEKLDPNKINFKFIEVKTLYNAYEIIKKQIADGK